MQGSLEAPLRGVPKASLGNNGKPWSAKMSELILVPQGFPFFSSDPNNSVS
jgi:hypothetical protein